MIKDQPRHLPPPANQADAQAFCDLCQWVYYCWLTHSHLFERLPVRLEQECNLPEAELLETPSGRCLGRLNEISLDYIILQIAKLHDPAHQGENENLSIDFFVRQEFWSEEEKQIINRIAFELDNFYKKIHNVRNKILAHNDRATFAEDKSLGGFPEGDDETYFDSLGRFCSLIWDKFPNGKWSYRCRVFNFTKSGLEKDPLCPSTEARKLNDLIVFAVSKNHGDIDPV